MMDYRARQHMAWVFPLMARLFGLPARSIAMPMYTLCLNWNRLAKFLLGSTRSGLRLPRMAKPLISAQLATT